MATTDEHYMRLAIREAKKGLGYTSPNPCVGAVIVKDGQIIGKGYHHKAGGPHAEIHAINDARVDTRGSTIYVTLEPCNHTGKTPPCTHAIVKAGMTRVVVGMVDPNPLVSGSGIRFLQEHGVEVVSGVLAGQCERFNHPFIKYITTRMPWMVMKAGISLDGKLNYQAGESGWITGPTSVRAVHKLRHQYDAIMVGRTTVLIDNPSLTTRLGRSRGKDPVRIILDTSLTLPTELKIFHNDSSAPTWVLYGRGAAVPPEIPGHLRDKIKYIAVSMENGALNLTEIVKTLGEKGVCSVLVEGGAKLHGAMLKAQLYDYAYLFQAPIFAGDGGVSLISGMSLRAKVQAPWIKDAKSSPMGDDRLIHGKVGYPS